MIIWLASYPKSGNTWLRSFLTSLIYEKDGNSNLKNLNFIRQYPLRSDFKGFIHDFKKINDVTKNWSTTQDKINLDKKIKFLKTHHILCGINKNFFTNYKNSLGVIYIVRDPRNVITSLMNHYSIENYDQALKFILDKDRFSGKFGEKSSFTRETEFPTYISNWNNHYNSWKSFKKNYLLIRYEDLVKDPQAKFKEIANYLGKLLNIQIDNEDINYAITQSSFKNLKKSEEVYGFDEAPPDEITNKKKKFFNLGPDNLWQRYLSKDIQNKIENAFKNEMKELNYL